MKNPNLQGKRYISLVRCSTASQADTSIEDQLVVVDAFAREHEMVHVGDVMLEGVSGSIPGNRSDIDQLIARKRDRNGFDVLLVQDTTRLTRGGPKHGAKIEFDLESAGIEVVFVTDNLPETGITFLNASRTPDSISGDQLVFNLGDLANGESTSITIEVLVDDNFSGTLLNQSEVRGNEAEITLANTEDTEPTLVTIDPASLAGSVFVDRNDNGVFDSGEAPIGGVLISLVGVDITGATVVRSTQTALDGSYLFENLNPGTYRLVETQPTRYNDGQDNIGTNGGAHGENPGALLIPNDVDPSQIQDLFLEIQISSGDAAVDYDFGELAAHISKINFIGSANW